MSRDSDQPEELTTLRSGTYSRKEILSHGPIAIWAHYKKDLAPEERKGYRCEVRVTSSTFHGRFMTLYVKTQISIDATVPIYVPEPVGLVNEPGAEFNRIDVDPANHIEEPIVVVIYVADVQKYKDVIECTPGKGCIVFTSPDCQFVESDEEICNNGSETHVSTATAPSTDTYGKKPVV